MKTKPHVFVVQNGLCQVRAGDSLDSVKLGVGINRTEALVNAKQRLAMFQQQVAAELRATQPEETVA
jgi:hypothetical protein